MRDRSLRYEYACVSRPTHGDCTPLCAETKLPSRARCSGARSRAPAGRPQRRDHRLHVAARAAPPAGARGGGRGRPCAGTRPARSGVDRPGLEPAARPPRSRPRAGAPRSPRARRSSRGPSSRPGARRRAARRADLVGQPRGSASTLPSPPHWATSRPPGRSAAYRRANSASWSAIQWKTAFEKTASTGSSSSSSVRSAWSTVARSPSASRACSTIDGAASTAITRPSGRRSSSSSVTRPVPQPASSTVSSPRSGSRSSTGLGHLDLRLETRS